MIEVSTSILSVPEELSMKTFYNLEQAKTNYFHIDVMDGKFVEADTTELMIKYISNLNLMTNSPLDVHLMVKDVKKYINEYVTFNPNIITFHYEALKNDEEVMEVIRYIKSNNIKVGLAIKPSTNVEKIYPFLPYIHMILVMSVEPGKGGQKFMVESLERIENIKNKIDKEMLDIDIEVDGGINKETSKQVINAGANILVSGSAIISSSDYTKTIEGIKQI